MANWISELRKLSKKAVVLDSNGQMVANESGSPVGARGEIAVYDAFGHSLTQTGHVERIARSMGANVCRSAGIGGAVACQFDSTYGGSGMGGWGWVLGTQLYHGIRPREGWPGQYDDYLPVRSIAEIFFGLNDLGRLGRNKPQPWLEAMRSMISGMLSVANIEHDDASVLKTGTWANAAIGGGASGARAQYAYSTTKGDTIRLRTPTRFRGGVINVPLIVNPDYDYTLDFKVGATTVLSRRFQGSALCDPDTTVNGPNNKKLNLVSNRIVVPPGQQDLTVVIGDINAAGSLPLIDGFWVEAADDQAPVVVVPGLNRPLGWNLWSTAPGYASLSSNGGADGDAAVGEWNVLLQSLVDEFGPSVVFTDIDSRLNKDPAFWSGGMSGDLAHLNARGDEVIGEAVIEAIDSVWTRRRSLSVNPLPAPPECRPFGLAGAVAALTNAWSATAGVAIGPNAGARPLSIGRELDGAIVMEGRAAGANTAAAIADLGLEWRPNRWARQKVQTDANADALLTIDPTNGRISVAVGYAAGMNINVPRMRWYPSVPQLG